MIETFTLEEFEGVISYLPFQPLGIDRGEYIYRLKLDGQARLIIRSSVNIRGVSADSGKDSIRVWLVDGDDQPLAAKTKQHIKRLPGWQDRLREMISEISSNRLLTGDCPKCQKPKSIFKSNTPKNRNRLFAKCVDCGEFVWLDEIKVGNAYFSKGEDNGNINTNKRGDANPPELQEESINPSNENLPGLSGSIKDDSSGLAAFMAVAEEKEESVPIPDCPKCNTPMLPKSGKYGDFWGCSNFPSCRTTRKRNKPEQKKSPIDFGSLVLSKYQNKIKSFVQTFEQHAKVDGVAGCGKTFSNVMALNELPKSASIKFTTFNTHNEVDIAAKAPSYVNVSTYHKWGLANIRRINPDVKINKYKIHGLIDSYKIDAGYEFKGTANKLIGLLKGSLLKPTPENILNMANDFHVDIEDKQVEIIIRAFNDSIADVSQVDFEDMVYFAAAGIVPCEKFDYIIVDEFQDTNMAQAALSMKSLHSDSRMMITGDPFQSLYAFRGAHTGIMDWMKERLNMVELPLSISYRAPLSIVGLVNEKFGHIKFEAAPNAILGEIGNRNYEDFYNTVKPGDGIICRTNAPLIKPCFNLIRQGIKATILGRNIGENLTNLIKRREKLVSVKNLDDLLFQIEEYRKNETAKHLATKKIAKAALLDDQCQTLYALADECRTITDLKTKTKSTFSDGKEGIILSTIHKAKGLEWPRVFIFEPQLMPHPMAKGERDKEQEKNIEYVAITRTKNQLYFVR